jgi:outer membrane protein assembly factor BamA
MAALGSSATAQQSETPAVQSRVEPAAPAPEARSQEPGASSSGDGFVSKMQNWASDHQLLERMNGDVDGWYPRLGRMTRGGGFAFGPGYRLHPFGGPVLVDMSAGISLKGYKAADANIRWYQSANEKFELWTDYRYEDFPQEDYFGYGFDSLVANRTSYGFEGHNFQARGVAKPLPWWSVGVNGGYMNVQTRGGSDKNFPSIEALFTDADTPGLFSEPEYLHATIFTEVDYRDIKGNPGSGGLYTVSYGSWNDRLLAAYDFQRFDVSLRQYVPLSASKKHVLSGRLGLSFTNNDASSRVPFYFLPYVGGVDTIRSFREFRFKDENAMWLGAEYLFRPIKYVGLAAFIDGGKVAHNWDDLGTDGMKKGYGFGLRFGTRKQTFGRIDMGFGGGEGKRIFFKLGPSL